MEIVKVVITPPPSLSFIVSQKLTLERFKPFMLKIHPISTS